MTSFEIWKEFWKLPQTVPLIYFVCSSTAGIFRCHNIALSPASCYPPVDFPDLYFCVSIFMSSWKEKKLNYSKLIELKSISYRWTIGTDTKFVNHFMPLVFFYILQTHFSMPSKHIRKEVFCRKIKKVL